MRACDRDALLTLYNVFNKAPVIVAVGPTADIATAARALHLWTRLQAPVMLLLDSIRHQDPAAEIRERAAAVQEANDAV